MVTGMTPAAAMRQTASLIFLNESSIALGVTRTLPQSTTPKRFSGLKSAKGGWKGRTRLECSRMAFGPWRAPMRLGWVPQSKGIPRIAARLFARSWE